MVGLLGALVCLLAFGCVERVPPAAEAAEVASFRFADSGPDCPGAWEHLPLAFGFAEGSAELDPANRELAGELIEAIQRRRDVVFIRVEGHTTWCADEPEVSLPVARAQAVLGELAARGVPRDRLRVVGVPRPERAPCSCSPPGRAPTQGLSRAEVSLRVCGEPSATPDATRSTSGGSLRAGIRRVR